MKILIAGIGNVLRGDDGFGILLGRTLCHVHGHPCRYSHARVLKANR